MPPNKALESLDKELRIATAMKYRAMGLHEQTLSEDDLLRRMTEEYTFITRPVIVRGDRATAGFSAKQVDALVG
jgi:arsenate reductase